MHRGDDGSDTKPVLLLLADISGYTRFMLSHGTALRHSQTIISELLEALLRRIDVPLRLASVEGDALFLYAIKSDEEEVWRRRSSDLVGQLLTLFRVFHERLLEIGAYSVCSCEACSRVGNLKLKIVAHSGHALFTQVGGHPTLSGVDVITVHRLAKNTVPEDEYLLMSGTAYRDLELPEGAEVRGGSEEYDTGTIATHVYLPVVDVSVDEAAMRAGFSDDNAAVKILRDEIQHEYTTVASDPTQGFHFNVGRRALDTIGYEEQLTQGIPDAVIDSFAGMGSPFSMGALRDGEYVVDVGSGSGLDSLIAARQVGGAGFVVGVEMTDAMLEKAEAARVGLGLTQLEFRTGYAESLPVPDGWADVVISNGVVNLSPTKERVFSEMYRVLRPGGRIQIADISVQRPIPQEAKREIDLWAG